MIESRSRPTTHELRTAIFTEAVTVLERELSSQITVEDVARQVATSPRQLHRAFSDVAGISFRAYLTRMRMTRAADLLASTDMPVKEVGRRVGYPAASAFAKAFSATHGVPPSEFRRARRS